MNAKKIVLGVVEPDIDPRDVVDRAAWIAALNGASLELLLCDADVDALSETAFVSNEAREMAARIRTAQEELVDELAAPARKRAVEVVAGVLDRRPIADAIVHVALDRHPLFVVKGTRYHSEAERASLLDTDWQLIRGCPYPLWLVKPHPLANRPVVIAAVDPMHEGVRMATLDDLLIEHAKALAAAAGGEAHLLHVYQPLTGVGAAATLNFKPIRLSVGDISERMGKEHRENLDALAAKHGIDERHVRQLPGSALDLLPWVAREQKADVFVMGAVAGSARSGGVVGRTVERVLDHLPCDVLILRPEA
ncbi:MAG TPA: universal stress protein [Woeseiaceae bacterium]|jgi:universal stress protein E|nr:universal stress protein [Woeseiaceae bacterium]